MRVFSDVDSVQEYILQRKADATRLAERAEAAIELLDAGATHSDLALRFGINWGTKRAIVADAVRYRGEAYAYHDAAEALGEIKPEFLAEMERRRAREFSRSAVREAGGGRGMTIDVAALADYADRQGYEMARSEERHGTPHDDGRLALSDIIEMTNRALNAQGVDWEEVDPDELTKAGETVAKSYEIAYHEAKEST